MFKTKFVYAWIYVLIIFCIGIYLGVVGLYNWNIYMMSASVIFLMLGWFNYYTVENMELIDKKYSKTN
jgi:intracellular septation protein A